MSVEVFLEGRAWDFKRRWLPYIRLYRWGKSWQLMIYRTANDYGRPAWRMRIILNKRLPDGRRIKWRT